MRFGENRLAWVAPDDYPPQPDHPTFTYRELLGLAKHGTAEMFDDMYAMKQVFCNCRAEGIRKYKNKTAGGFALPDGN